MVDDIVVNVPKDWNDEKKQDLAKALDKLKLPNDIRILITNKMDVKFVSPETMDRLRDG